MQTKEEIWKDIKGYEGQYQVSNMGNVRSLNYHRSGKCKIMKLSLNHIGYLYVCLKVNGIQKTYRVSRLVAQAFVPNDDPEHKTQCNHINEDKLDNRACNLNWMTPKENVNWGTCIERRNLKNINHNKSKAVRQLTKDGVLVTIWPSAMEAQRNGFCESHITACCNNKKGFYTHKGYKWEWVC